MFTDLLDEAIDAWTDARQGLIAELRNIPPARFGFRPAPAVRSVAEVTRHVLEVGLMMVGELGRKDTNFHRLPWPELVVLYARGAAKLEKKSALTTALRQSLERGRQTLRDAGEIHMLQTIERFDGELGTRLAWFQHGVAHEMYHRGQLALYQRLMGIEPALTRRIRGASPSLPAPISRPDAKPAEAQRPG